MAAAMAGSASSAPLWTGHAAHTWHLGGHQNFAVPFVRKESLLLLSQWIRLPVMTCTSGMLQQLAVA